MKRADSQAVSTAPVELRLAKNRKSFEVLWRDGRQSRFAAASLRAYSRSARALRHRLDGSARSAPDVLIGDLQLVGAYAVNIAFSDGEERGIFPWSYLRQLDDAGWPPSETESETCP